MRVGVGRLGCFSMAIATAALLGASSEAAAQSVQRPFFAGERLDYRVKVGRFGTIGRGAMWVEGPVELRGSQAYILRFDFRARVGPFKAVDRTESWIDPSRMAALRYHKHERHLLSSNDEQVELFPDAHRWEAGNGEAGDSPTEAPLDELSFIYFVRTLPLPADTSYSLDRHFDAKRNPVTVRVLGRERVATGAGDFHTVLVEMRVMDPRRYQGEGVIRINLTDDDCRLPVRIESAVPKVGTTVFTLSSHTHPAAHAIARAF